ncbi:unnamed protein product [Closterium sp. NIES-64]|nr:unnamed protein product [Closterium sp. NIES-64]
MQRIGFVTRESFHDQPAPTTLPTQPDPPFPHRLREEPAAYGRLGLATLLEMREECLREFHFFDAYRAVKQRENDVSLSVLPDLLAELDSIPPVSSTAFLLAAADGYGGVLAANIFDWGSRECVKLYRSGTILEIYRMSRDKMKRPWRVDDFDAFHQRWQHRPYGKALLFVDNAGADVVLGMLPLAREMLRAGTNVSGMGVVGCNGNGSDFTGYKCGGYEMQRLPPALPAPAVQHSQALLFVDNAGVVVVLLGMLVSRLKVTSLRGAGDAASGPRDAANPLPPPLPTLPALAACTLNGGQLAASHQWRCIRPAAFLTLCTCSAPWCFLTAALVFPHGCPASPRHHPTSSCLPFPPLQVALVANLLPAIKDATSEPTALPVWCLMHLNSTPHHPSAPLPLALQVVLVANSLPAINDVTADELTAVVAEAAQHCPVLRAAAEAGGVMAEDASRSTQDLQLRGNEHQGEGRQAAGQADPPLVVLEGMGRSLHTNYDTRFTCDSLKFPLLTFLPPSPCLIPPLSTLLPTNLCQLAMIKNERLAKRLVGGSMYDCVCRFQPGTKSERDGESEGDGMR